jgi:putative tryptophan/tyrosine transport system substrate-binding protein
MRRREFMAMASGAAIWPLASSAQQPGPPVIGFLRSTPAGPFAHVLSAFREGLARTGYVDGQNLAIEQRWADNKSERLPALALELVQRNVAVLVGNGPAMEAAKAVTATIPIVFVVGDDPVKSGLVTSLNRPGGNLTGVTFFAGSELDTKRLELLDELTPKGVVVGVLVDRTHAAFVSELPNIEAAGHALGRKTVLVEIEGEGELDTAFAEIVRVGAGAVLVTGGPLFTSHRRKIVALAAHHTLPAIYDVREFVDAGGLISYSASITDAHREAGVYVGKILKGTKPSELPIRRPTKLDLVINLATAKALGLTIPPTLLARADEVIE